MTSSTDGTRGAIAPGPSGNPITGQLEPFERDPLRFLLDTHRAYGDIARLYLWPQLAHLISHPAGVRHVLATNAANYHDPTAAHGLLPRDQEGRLTNTAALPQRLATLAQQVFHGNRVQTFAPAMGADVAAMLARWQGDAGSGQPIDVFAEMVRLSLGILGTTLFNTDLSDDLDTIVPALTVSLMYAAPQRHVSSMQRLRRSPADIDPALPEAVRTLEEFAGRLIDERRRAGQDHGDLLSLLVFTRDDATGGTVTDAQLVEMVLVVLIAGHSAIASALTWSWYLLAQHPQAEGRLQAELDAALGGRDATAADLPKLRYTSMVLQEAMRLYPPVWLLQPRVALGPDEIGGYYIPARSMVLMSPYVLHRHPDFWEQPDEFQPERFAKPTPDAWFPFGAGPWGCIGSQFGLLEARLALATVAQRYRLALVPGHPVELEPEVSLRPRYGLRMMVEKQR